MASPYLQPVLAFSCFVNYFTRVNLRQGINFNNVPGRVLEVRDVRLPCRMEEVRICCRKFPPTAARPKFLL
jgi:hypothetical protein